MPELSLTYEEMEANGQVKVVLTLDRRDSAGKLWRSLGSGQGQDRRDAVAAAVADLPKKLVYALTKVAEGKYTEAPEAIETPVEAEVPVAAGEVAPRPKSLSLPVVPALSQPQPTGGASLSQPKPSDNSAGIVSPQLTARKRGWPKGKPRGPRKVSAQPSAGSQEPISSTKPDGAPSLPKTEGQELPPRSSGAEPF